MKTASIREILENPKVMGTADILDLSSIFDIGESEHLTVEIRKQYQKDSFDVQTLGKEFLLCIINKNDLPSNDSEFEYTYYNSNGSREIGVITSQGPVFNVNTHENLVYFETEEGEWLLTILGDTNEQWQ